MEQLSVNPILLQNKIVYYLPGFFQTNNLLAVKYQKPLHAELILSPT